jgi:hypothetical protein
MAAQGLADLPCYGCDDEEEDKEGRGRSSTHLAWPRPGSDGDEGGGALTGGARLRRPPLLLCVVV